MTALRWTSAMLACFVLTACGGGKTAVYPAGSGTPQVSATGTPAAQTWPAALPKDGVQPWETTDANGHVIPAAKSSSSINGQSIFASGVESFTTGGGTVTPTGEATRLDSGAAGAHALSYATYRLTLGGTQPGVVGLDVNLNSASSGYWVGLSDYAANHWVWRGPFTDNHIRLVKAPGQLDSANYLSPSGNLFVAVAAYDGSRVDVVGVGTNPVTDGDAALPPAPTALGVTPEHGGLLLEWTPSAAADLAGYRILWSNSSFAAATDSGVHTYDYSDGGGRLFLPLLAPLRLTFVAVQAVDIAGNISPPTAVHSAVPLTGTPPALTVTTSAPSGLHDSAITLTASGASSYDFDLDGDGVYDVTGDTTGHAAVDTSKPGIIRPGVRGHGSDGSAVALGGVSLIITGNTRPAVSATATPQAGSAPLDVTFTASAQDAEDLPAALTYDWDFDGDGIYDSLGTATNIHDIYTTPGLFNAKVRVTDTQGAWSTDTLSIVVGVAPAASFSVSAQQQILPMRLNYNFNGTGSTGLLTTYEWDFDGDGTFDSPAGALASHSYPGVGTYRAKLQVTDSLGSFSTQTRTVYVPSIWCSCSGRPGNTTRVSPVVGPQTNHVKWSYATGGFVASTALVGADGTIYVGSVDGKVYALADNGTPTPTVKWSYNTAVGFNLSGLALGADGTVYGANNNGLLVALVDNGTPTPTLKWSFSKPSMNSSPAIGPDGTVYIGSGDQSVYALVDNGTTTPTVKWSYATGGVVDYSSPALGPDGTVYVGSEDGKLYALVDNGTATPNVKWSFAAGAGVGGGPSLGPDGTVYVGAKDNKLYALVDNGTITPTVKWSFTSGNAIYDSAVIGPDGTVYIGSHDNKIYALVDNGTATPTVKWSYLTGGTLFASGVLGADGTYYQGSADGKIYALVDSGTSTPTVKWSCATGGGVWSPLSIGPDGRLYGGSDDKSLYCFAP